jgi:hypothetical protein
VAVKDLDIFENRVTPKKFLCNIDPSWQAILSGATDLCVGIQGLKSTPR